MSNIISYPAASPELSDLLLGTKYDQDTNPTKNFSVNGLRDVIAENTNIEIQNIMSAFTEEDTITSIGVAQTVPIGAAQSTTDVSLNGSGIFTFNDSGTYSIKVVANFGAEDYVESGNRYVLFATYYNNTQYDMADVCVINQSSRYATKEYNFLFNAVAGDNIRFKVASSAGETGGGVISYDATPFYTIPAISVYIDKLILA